MDGICLREARGDVDKKYVGFVPNGSAVKPVHIAGGSLRCIYGKYNKTVVYNFKQPLHQTELRPARL